MLPITHEAILKQYSTKGETSAAIDKWTDNDGNDYFAVLWSLIKNFLGIKDEKELAVPSINKQNGAGI